MTDDTTTRADGSGELVSPDDKTPTWRERKERKAGLARVTYEYFERGRLEDQRLRQDSDYIERDVLGFPTWPHETIRNLSIASFFVGIIFLLSATLPPEFGPEADPSVTPEVILPDWYLYPAFGLLQLEPINPELALLGGQKLMTDQLYGVLATGVVVGVLFVYPFVNKGSARRPVEEPFWAAVGMVGLTFGFTVSVLSIDQIVSSRVPGMTAPLVFDLSLFVPVVVGLITYAALRAMREGYMYELNRRYYRLRPPR
ncbi:MAG: cytochrome bc complex cytochrome b subunit [Halobacteriales archaeon]